jgi:hypothetical protein
VHVARLNAYIINNCSFNLRLPDQTSSRSSHHNNISPNIRLFHPLVVQIFQVLFINKKQTFFLDLLRPTINSVKKLIKNLDKTKPIRVPIGTKLITTLNTTVVVRCPTTARPRAVLSWQRNGEAIVANEKYKLNGDKSELTIMDMQFSDNGVYVCSAFNRAGTDFESMDITVASK